MSLRERERVRAGKVKGKAKRKGKGKRKRERGKTRGRFYFSTAWARGKNPQTTCSVLYRKERYSSKQLTVPRDSYLHTYYPAEYKIYLLTDTSGKSA
jgi:hypothetical protein